MSEPGDDFVSRVRANFDLQNVMKLIGARLTVVEPGHVEIELPYRPELGQQDGWFHAGVLTTIADSAGGYAAYTLMPPGSNVLTIEYKMNFITPAKGEKVVAVARVVRPGRKMTVCELSVDSIDAGKRKTCVLGLQTLVRADWTPAAKKIP